jgi:hypothetical protein
VIINLDKKLHLQKTRQKLLLPCFAIYIVHLVCILFYGHNNNLTVTLLALLALLALLINRVNNNNKKKIKFASSTTCVTNAVVTVSTLAKLELLLKNNHIFNITTMQLIIQVASDYFDNMSSESQKLLFDDPLSFFKSNFRMTGKLKANS